MTDSTKQTKQKKLFQTPTKAQNRQRAVAWALRVATGTLGQFGQLAPRLRSEATANRDNITGEYFDQLLLEIQRCEAQLEKLKRAALAANSRIHGQYLLEQEEKISAKTQKEG